MTLLQLIIVLTCFVFLLFSVDAYQRWRVNGLHMLVFVWGSAGIAAFLFSPDLLESFGNFFWLARGADLLVYLAIIALGYFYFELLHALTKQKSETTRLCTAYAMQTVKKEQLPLLPDQKTKNEKSHIWFLVRAYNEEKTIGSVIDEIIANGYTTVVVVNDGSKDDTAGVVEQKKQAYPDVRVLLLSHLINRWGGAANKTLYDFATQYAQQLWIERWVTFDADGQMDVADMDTFALYMKTNAYDVLLGSRFVEGWVAEDMPLLRGIILRWGRVLTRIFNGIRISDPHNGYRVRTSSAISQIRITSDGMLYANEVNDEIKKHQLRFCEVPVYIRYTEYSLWKWQKNSNALKILIELIYRKIFFR